MDEKFGEQVKQAYAAWMDGLKEAREADLRAEGAAAERGRVLAKIADILGGDRGCAHLELLEIWLKDEQAAAPRGELERAVAAAEKDVLARFRGRLVAFLEDGEAVVVEGVPRDTAAVSLGSASFSRSEVDLTVRFKIRQEETPEERGRREGREVGLELARRAASAAVSGYPDLVRLVVESINKAAEAAKKN